MEINSSQFHLVRGFEIKGGVAAICMVLTSYICILECFAIKPSSRVTITDAGSLASVHLAKGKKHSHSQHLTISYLQGDLHESSPKVYTPCNDSQTGVSVLAVVIASAASPTSVSDKLSVDNLPLLSTKSSCSLFPHLRNNGNVWGMWQRNP